LRREDLVVIACTGLAAGLAWAWLMRGAGLTMDAMMAPPFSAAYLAPAFAMWALMMVAMMLPSALPMILLHARVARQGHGGALPSGTLVFALAYVGLWAGFALAAALGQAALVASGAVSAMGLALGDRVVAAALLAFAAAWQLSSLKRACLDKCRSPLSFILRGFKPHWRAALRLGFAHGLYCIGCCWALMLLLFVGGVMNLAWIAVLGTAVIAEKYGPAWTSKAIALLMVAGAAGLVAVSS
jgi:predicted metal-binding membrane protein